MKNSNNYPVISASMNFFDNYFPEKIEFIFAKFFIFTIVILFFMKNTLLTHGGLIMQRDKDQPQRPGEPKRAQGQNDKEQTKKPFNK